jgi:uncharacterized protein
LRVVVRRRVGIGRVDGRSGDDPCRPHARDRAKDLAEPAAVPRPQDLALKPSLLEPQVIYRYEIDLAPTSNLFKASPRIRVEISSSNFPRFDRNGNTGGRIADEHELCGVVQHVYHDLERPSLITLPIIR